MSHTYCAADFASLPQPALDALGVKSIRCSDDSTIINFGDAGFTVAPHDRAASLLIGMVQAKCSHIKISKHTTLDRAYRTVVTVGDWTVTDTGPSPLSATLGVYAKAVTQ